MSLNSGQSCDGGRELRGGKILVIDDDPDILALLKKGFENRGYEVVTAANGAEGIQLSNTAQPDLIILDVELPDFDGIEVCQRIRHNSIVPIIFLTIRSEETDVVLGLGVGADNYISKPFKMPELIAKVEAAIRREKTYSQRKKRPVVNVKDLTLDLGAFEVKKRGESIRLTATEFKLLRVLAENADQVLSRDQLLDSVWGLRAEGVFTRTVDVHVGRLRKKIEDDPQRPRYILTVPGMGYKMPQ